MEEADDLRGLSPQELAAIGSTEATELLNSINASSKFDYDVAMTSADTSFPAEESSQDNREAKFELHQDSKPTSLPSGTIGSGVYLSQLIELLNESVTMSGGDKNYQ